MNKDQLKKVALTIKEYTETSITNTANKINNRIDDLEETMTTVPSSPTYEIQSTTLTFNEGSNVLQLSTDIQNCTCNIEYILEESQSIQVADATNVPSFTNLIPFNPLSNASTSSSNGIQAYKGKREFIGDNVVKYTCTNETGGGIFKSQSVPTNIVANHKYYYRCYVSDDGNTWTIAQNKVVTASDTGTISVGDSTLLNITSIANGSTKYIKNPLIIDLTEMYGVGNEPTANEMLTIIPEDAWSNGEYVAGSDTPEEPTEPMIFTVTSKDNQGSMIDTYVSTSEDKTLDIVSGGTIEIDNKPHSITFTNVQIKVLVSTGGTTVATSTKNKITLHNVDRLLFIGDSYTEGIYYQKGKAWVCQLAEQLDYTCEGYGWGGYTCRTLADNIKQNLTRYNSIPVQNLNATRAMLMSFVNDMAKGGTNSGVFQGNMEELIKTVYDMGCKPIVCTEFRDVWGTGIQPGLKALSQKYNCDFWNILPYTIFLGATTASDNEEYRPYYNGSHPAQRTGGIIFNNYLKFAENLPRPNSALKIYRLREGISVTSVDDLLFETRRDKLLKFKEIAISHSCLSKPEDWDNVSDMTGTSQNGVESEYGKLMSNQNVEFGNYALVECVLPTLKGSIKSLKLCLSDSTVSLYVKKERKFVECANKITDFSGIMEYDKVTFLVYKQGGFSLNDIYVEWEGQTVEKHNVKNKLVATKGTELLTKNTMEDISWLTTTGTITQADPTNYTLMPSKCTKLITVNNTNYVTFSAIPKNNIPGTISLAKVRVACRYNPTKSSTEINVNSYDRKELELRIAGQNMTNIPTSYYSIKHEVDMSWTMCEFEVELNGSNKFTILSSDNTPLEVCYISVIEI